MARRRSRSLRLREALARVERGHAAERRFDTLALLASRVREIGFADQRDRNDADCEVQFALGQVLLRTRRWAEAGERFVATARCSRGAQMALTARLGEIAAATLDPVRRQRLAARVERDRSIEHRREGLATLSGAAAFAGADRPADARPLGEAALNWPETRDKARELLARLVR